MKTQPLKHDLFVYEYQKHLICSYVMQMSVRKLKAVALYQFGDSQSELAYRTAKSIAGDDELFEAFLDRFPPSWLERLNMQDDLLGLLQCRATFSSLNASSPMERKPEK